jgi:hypothetical protein
MQIIPSTQRALGVTDPFDPVQSIYAGAKYMDEALSKEGRPDLALLYYHGGPGWRDKYGKESAGYVPAVTGHYQKLVREAANQPTPAQSASDQPAAPPPEVGNAMAKKDDKVESDEDFLKRTGNASGAESDDDFLKRTGAVGGETTAKVEDAPPGPYSEYGDLAAQPWAQGTPPAADSMAPVAKALSSGQGMRNALVPPPGYVRTPIPFLPFAFKETVPGSGEIDPSSGLSGLKFDPGAAIAPIANPLLDFLAGTGLETSMGGQNAPLAGKVSPEATALLLGARMGMRPRNALDFTPLERPPSAGDLKAAPLPPDFKAAPMTPEAVATAREAATASPDATTSTPTGTPATPPPAPAEPPPTGPRSAGAAASSTYEAIHTPAEEAAYRANTEGKKLLEPQKIGEPDLNQYIPGETANSAEREQTVKTARELKELGIRVPEASQIDREAAERNNTARVIYAENTAKGPVEIANRTAQRETDINADKKTVFAPENIKGAFDKQPVVDYMESVLKDPENIHNSALQSLYRQQLARVKSADFGNPVEAWSLRRDFDRLTSKRMQADDPNLHSIGHFLNGASDVIDSQIEKVAPGYGDMLAKYKEHSRAINEMEVLQGALKNLRGPGQKMTYNDFQRFMKNVVDSRMTPATDLNPYKAISEENMLRLWNIRDSLRRSASAKELAQAAGSDTMPNIIDALKGIGKMGGTAALHAYVGAHLGPGGNFALQSLAALGKSLNDQRMIKRATRQMNLLMNPSRPLRPPPGQENPLTGAGSP